MVAKSKRSRNIGERNGGMMTAAALKRTKAEMVLEDMVTTAALKRIKAEEVLEEAFCNQRTWLITAQLAHSTIKIGILMTWLDGSKNT